MPAHELVEINPGQNQNKKHLCNETLDDLANSIPSMFDLACAMNASKSNSAWGENSICPRIYKNLQVLWQIYIFH